MVSVNEKSKRGERMTEKDEIFKNTDRIKETERERKFVRENRRITHKDRMRNKWNDRKMLKERMKEWDIDECIQLERFSVLEQKQISFKLLIQCIAQDVICPAWWTFQAEDLIRWNRLQAPTTMQCYSCQGGWNCYVGEHECLDVSPLYKKQQR